MDGLNFNNNSKNLVEIEQRIQGAIQSFKNNGYTTEKIKTIFKECVYDFLSNCFKLMELEDKQRSDVEWLHKAYHNELAFIESAFQTRMKSIFEASLIKAFSPPAPVATVAQPQPVLLGWAALANPSAPMSLAPASGWAALAYPAAPISIPVIEKKDEPAPQSDEMTKWTPKQVKEQLFGNFEAKQIPYQMYMLEPGQKGLLPAGTKNAKLFVKNAWALISKECDGTKIELARESFIGIKSNDVEIKKANKCVIVIDDNCRNVKISGDNNIIILVGYARVEMSDQDLLNNTIFKENSYSIDKSYNESCATTLGKLTIPSSSKIKNLVCSDKRFIQVGDYSEVELLGPNNAVISFGSSCKVRISSAVNCKVDLDKGCSEFMLGGKDNEIFVGNWSYKVSVIDNGGSNTVHNPHNATIMHTQVKP